MYFLYVTNFFINMILIPENEKAGGLWFDGGIRYLGQCHSYDGMFALRERCRALMLSMTDKIFILQS